MPFFERGDAVPGKEGYKKNASRETGSNEHFKGEPGIEPDMSTEQARGEPARGGKEQIARTPAW